MLGYLQMINLKKETLSFISGNKKKLICATVTRSSKKSSTFLLPLKSTKEVVKQFFTSLNFDYDNGYGFQEVYGILWFKDGSWAKRVNYNGSEWWQLYELPSIPKELQCITTKST